MLTLEQVIAALHALGWRIVERRARSGSAWLMYPDNCQKGFFNLRDLLAEVQS